MLLESHTVPFANWTCAMAGSQSSHDAPSTVRLSPVFLSIKTIPKSELLIEMSLGKIFAPNTKVLWVLLTPEASTA